MNAFAQGAWSLLLRRYCGTCDLVFGATVAGRPPELEGVERMVGLFINTLPIRVRVDDDQRLIDWLTGLQKEQAQREAYSDTPLIEIQGWSPLTASTPLFDTMYAFENYPAGSLSGKAAATLRIESVMPTNRPITRSTWWSRPAKP